MERRAITCAIFGRRRVVVLRAEELHAVLLVASQAANTQRFENYARSAGGVSSLTLRRGSNRRSIGRLIAEIRGNDAIERGDIT